MRRVTKYLTLTAAMLGSTFAQAADLPNYNAYYDEPGLGPLPLSGALTAARALGVVTSVDEQRSASVAVIGV